MKRFTPEQYLKIDIANSFGLDKKTWQERINWFDKNQDKLEELVPQADEPACFYAGVLAWYRHKAGEPIGYAVGLDATSSGIQIFSCLSRDRKAAMLCNVLPRTKEEHRENIYQTITDMIGLEGIDKNDVKKAIMTSFYGSQAKPKEVFGNKLDSFIQAMETEMPYAWALNNYCLQIWDLNAYNYKWSMPDGFDVFCEVEETEDVEFPFNGKTLTFTKKVNAPKLKGRFLGANLAHSCDSLIVREITRMAMHDPEHIQYIKNIIEWNMQSPKNIYNEEVDKLWKIYKECGFLSYRILNHLNVDNIYLIDDKKAILDLIQELPKKPFKVYAIHQWWI